VQVPLQVVHERADRGRIASDALRADQGVDRRARCRPDAVSEGFAPTADAFIVSMRTRSVSMLVRALPPSRGAGPAIVIGSVDDDGFRLQ